MIYALPLLLYLEPYTDAYTHTHALTTNVNTGVNQRHYASSAHALGLKIVLRYDVLADAVSKRSIVQDAQQREHGSYGLSD